MLSPFALIIFGVSAFCLFKRVDKSKINDDPKLWPDGEIFKKKPKEPKINFIHQRWICSINFNFYVYDYILKVQ